MAAAAVMVHIPQLGEGGPNEAPGEGIYQVEPSVQVPAQEIEEIRQLPPNRLGWDGEVVLRDGTVHQTIDRDRVIAQVRGYYALTWRRRR